MPRHKVKRNHSSCSNTPPPPPPCGRVQASAAGLWADPPASHSPSQCLPPPSRSPHGPAWLLELQPLGPRSPWAGKSDGAGTPRQLHQRLCRGSPRLTAPAAVAASAGVQGARVCAAPGVRGCAPCPSPFAKDGATALPTGGTGAGGTGGQGQQRGAPPPPRLGAAPCPGGLAHGLPRAPSRAGCVASYLHPPPQELAGPRCPPAPPPGVLRPPCLAPVSLSAAPRPPPPPPCGWTSISSLSSG